jgi:hypothetical protein
VVIDKIVTFRFCSKGDQNVIQPGNLLKVICESLQNFKFLIRLLFKAHAIVDSVSSLIAATVQPFFSLFRGLISSSICWSGSTAAVQFHRNPCFVCSMVVIFLRELKIE